MKTASDAVLLRRSERRRRALQARFDAAGGRIRRLADANVRLSETGAGLLRLLSRAAGGGDLAEAGHGERTARVATLLARRMGVAPEMLDDVRVAALLHDVGRGPAGCADEEAGHAERALGLLETLPLSAGVLEAIRCHHDRWDGRGNRSRRAGDAIPLAARILAVADAFDELTAGGGDGSLDADEALSVLRSTAGRVHDPAVVEAFDGLAPGDLRRLGLRAETMTGALT